MVLLLSLPLAEVGVGKEKYEDLFKDLAEWKKESIRMSCSYQNLISTSSSSCLVREPFLRDVLVDI